MWTYRRLFLSKIAFTVGCCSSTPKLVSTFYLPERIQRQSFFGSLKSPCSIPNALRNQDGALPLSIFSTLFSSSSSENSSAMIDATILAGPNLPPIKAAAKRLFLVRHGEVINPGGDRAAYYGAMEVPLSPLGEAEATAAATYLKSREEEIDLVVSSPLSRAIFGANEVLKQQSALSQSDVLVLDGFTELDRGAWCGKTKDEIGDDLMARFDACDETVTPEGGESYPFLKNRVLQARDVVLDKLAPGRAAVIVSHLQVTRSMLSEALGIPIEQMSGLKVATASVTCIDYDSSAGTQTVHFQSFKPKVGLQTSRDGAN